MGQYGETAVRAVQLYASGIASSIVDAWKITGRNTLHAESSQDKSCPRTTFLGICESGIVAGVPAGKYNARPSVNKQYGLDAIALLRRQPTLVNDKTLLWKNIGNATKKPNEQMDVVATLWVNGLIK